MQFDELQTQWSAQKEEDMYTINQEALHQRVQQQMTKADRFTDFMEKALLVIYLIVGGGLIIFLPGREEQELAPYLIAATALFFAGYVAYVRMQRLRASGTFDRTLTGDLEQAISDTRHRVRISRMGLLFIPLIALFSFYQLWTEDKPAWVLGLMMAFFFFASLAGGWEHRNWHKGKLEELERMRGELGQ